MSCFKKNMLTIVVLAGFTCMGGVASASVIPFFNPGTYYLSQEPQGLPQPVDDTLVVTNVNGGVNFDLSGLDNYTWSIATGTLATGDLTSYFQYDANTISSVSWDPTIYDQLIYFSFAGGGGINIQSSSPDVVAPSLLVQDFAIAGSPGNIYNDPTAAPEPSTWLMMLAGFMALGFTGYRRRNTISIA